MYQIMARVSYPLWRVTVNTSAPVRVQYSRSACPSGRLIQSIRLAPASNTVAPGIARKAGCPCNGCRAASIVAASDRSGQGAPIWRFQWLTRSVTGPEVMLMAYMQDMPPMSSTLSTASVAGRSSARVQASAMRWCGWTWAEFLPPPGPPRGHQPPSFCLSTRERTQMADRDSNVSRAILVTACSPVAKIVPSALVSHTLACDSVHRKRSGRPVQTLSHEVPHRLTRRRSSAGSRRREGACKENAPP